MSIYSELATVLDNINAIESTIASTRRAGSLNLPDLNTWSEQIKTLKSRAIQLRDQINHTQRPLS